jgi:hypothetical protein
LDLARVRSALVRNRTAGRRCSLARRDGRRTARGSLARHRMAKPSSDPCHRRRAQQRHPLPWSCSFGSRRATRGRFLWFSRRGWRPPEARADPGTIVSSRSPTRPNRPPLARPSPDRRATPHRPGARRLAIPSQPSQAAGSGERTIRPAQPHQDADCRRLPQARRLMAIRGRRTRSGRVHSLTEHPEQGFCVERTTGVEPASLTLAR